MRTAFVTGAASGIGHAAALRLVRSGWQVAAVDTDEDRLSELPDLADLHPVNCDVTDDHVVQAAVKDVSDELGPPRLLIHAAGAGVVRPLLEHDPLDIKQLTEIVYGGTVTVARAVVPVMVDAGGGQVVLFGSIGGWIPIPGGGAYGAAKAAVHFFAEVLALETRAQGIQVVCVCPPMVETPLLERLRVDNPGMFGDRPGLSPEAVLDAMDRALACRRLWTFPGRTTRAMWTARRLAPRPLSALIARKAVGQ